MTLKHIKCQQSKNQQGGRPTYCWLQIKQLKSIFVSLDLKRLVKLVLEQLLSKEFQTVMKRLVKKYSKQLFLFLYFILYCVLYCYIL